MSGCLARVQTARRSQSSKVECNGRPAAHSMPGACRTYEQQYWKLRVQGCRICSGRATVCRQGMSVPRFAPHTNGQFTARLLFAPCTTRCLCRAGQTPCSRAGCTKQSGQSRVNKAKVTRQSQQAESSRPALGSSKCTTSMITLVFHLCSIAHVYWQQIATAQCLLVVLFKKQAPATCRGRSVLEGVFLCKPVSAAFGPLRDPHKHTLTNYHVILRSQACSGNHAVACSLLASTLTGCTDCSRQQWLRQAEASGPALLSLSWRSKWGSPSSPEPALSLQV